MARTDQPPFEGNLIRARDYAPCGCQDKPHWWLVEAEGELLSKACPGRREVEPWQAEDGETLGYKLR